MGKLFKLFRIFLYIPFFLSGFSSRSNNIWVFGGNYNAFSNGKYFARFLSQNCKSIKVVWVIRYQLDKETIQRDGFEAYYHWEVKGIYYSLVAKLFFVTSYNFDINYWLSKGGKIINLWHGIPIKKLNYDIKNGPQSKIFTRNKILNTLYSIFLLRLKSPHYLLTTSEDVSKILSGAFKITLDRCLLAGYPRIDATYSTNYGECNFEKKILYAPTWRDTNRDIFRPDTFDFLELNKTLQNRNIVLEIKPHPLTKVSTSILRAIHSNIKFLPNNINIYESLNSYECLITDYSSIFIDFLHLRKPILFFPFDFNEYIKNDRDLYFNYDEIIPGPKFSCFNELNTFLKTFNLNMIPHYKQKYDEISTFFWKDLDGNASKRLYEMILAEIV